MSALYDVNEEMKNFPFRVFSFLFVLFSTEEGQFVRPPTDKEQKGLLEEMRKWEEVLKFL